jgi:hypothetical protein
MQRLPQKRKKVVPVQKFCYDGPMPTWNDEEGGVFGQVSSGLKVVKNGKKIEGYHFYMLFVCFGY